MSRPATNTNGQIQKRRDDGSLLSMLNKMGPQIARALPKHVTPDRMLRVCMTALSANPKLQACTKESFLGSVLSAAQLGLEPNTPLQHCWLIPRGRECTLLVGYQGQIELSRRSGHVSAIYAFAVYPGDDFRYQLGLDPDIHHVPCEDEDRESRPLTHVYAVAKMRSGEPVFTVLPRSKIEAARRRSQASGSGPWTTDYEEMAKKTAIRRLWKWLPKSPEMVVAATLDDAAESGKQHQAWTEHTVEAITSEGMQVPSDGYDADEDQSAAQPPPDDDYPEPGSDG